jgi:hypothetical protein
MKPGKHSSEGTDHHSRHSHTAGCKQCQWLRGCFTLRKGLEKERLFTKLNAVSVTKHNWLVVWNIFYDFPYLE